MREIGNLIQELKKLNRQLKELRRSGRYMIYSAHPIKFAFYNFLAGIFHTLGSLVGYIIIGIIVFYLLRGIDWLQLTTNWLEKGLKNIRWEKVIPQNGQIVR